MYYIIELGNIPGLNQYESTYFVCTGFDIELTLYYQYIVKCQSIPCQSIPLNTVHISTSANFKKQSNFVSVIILGFKQMKLISRLCNSKKAISHIMGGCGKKPVLVIDRNTSIVCSPF